jgi:hypothetical protein
MLTKTKVSLKLVGYGGVVLVAAASGEFAFCVAYGFLLIEALLNAAEFWPRRAAERGVQGEPHE